MRAVLFALTLALGVGGTVGQRVALVCLDQREGAGLCHHLARTR